MSDLNTPTIQAHLNTKTYGRTLSIAEQTASTNDLAKTEARCGGAHGSVFIADTQTQGRGAQGHAWVSPPGSDIYLSIIERSMLRPEVLPTLTLAVGLGVAECVESLIHQPAQIKWPNDVLINNLKCAGILVESTIDEGKPTCIIGIGLNVNRPEWPAELEGIATSLLLQSQTRFDRSHVVASLLNHVEQRVRALEAQGPTHIANALRNKLAWVGEHVVCGDTTGTLRGVSDDGALRLDTPTGPKTLRSGTLRKHNN